MRIQRPSLLVGLFALLISSALAQQSARVSPAENATNALLRMHSNYQQSSPAQKSQLLTQFRTLAAQRQQLLISLIQTNPGDVLRFAIPRNIRGSMPASVQSYVEQAVQTQGSIEVLVEDAAAGSKMHYGLRTAGGKLALHFANKPPTRLTDGSVVRATGIQVGNDLALACCSSTNTSALQTVTSVLPNTFGPQSTLVILVNFQDNTTQPYSLTTANDVVFNQTSAWDMENSFQQTWLTGTVVGWYTLPMSSSTCDYSSIQTYANQAATAAGVNLSNYQHYVYAFPSISACSWWGLGTVGGAPSAAWINGSIAVKVVSHEMGHNFGLYHSHAWSCGSTTLGSNCTSIEYGDSIDTMGSPGAGHFNAFQKERLGWLNYGISPPLTTVQSNGTYSIGPYENQDATLKALKILASTDPTTGAHTYYYVEFRQASGEDTFLSNDPNVLSGVLIHRGTDADPNTSELLDMVPSLNNFYYSALDGGQSFLDPTAGLTLQTISTSGSSATVSVVFGTPACTHYNPTVAISPYQSQTMLPGATATYTVSVTNNDNAGCTSSSFNLAGTVPSGWTSSLSSPALSLAPGATGSTSLQVTSPSGASTGIYSFSASATNSATASFSGSNSATYVLNTTPCVNANPTVTISPNQSQSVQPGTTVTYVIAVRNNDNSSCTASTFHLSDSVPSGWTATLGMSTASLTVAPGSQSSTSLNVTSPANAPGGTYSLSGSATNATYSGATYSASSSAAYIVAGGSSVCTRNNPTVTIAPASQTGTPGTALSYAVTVKDNDSSSCPATNFNMGSSIPTGWTATWNTVSLNLTPASSSTANLTVASSMVASGTYSISASATDGAATSYASSANATYVASAPQASSIVITTNNSTYLPGQTVGIQVSLNSAGIAVPNARVLVSITTPTGVTTLSGTTGTNGVVALSYKLKRQAPAGVYQATATQSSTTGAVSLSPASTTFTVQ